MHTQVSYSHLAATPWAGGRQPITIRFDLRHNGPLAGTGTPQVYLTLPAATGETGSAAHPLSYWDTARQAWATAPGGGSRASQLPPPSASPSHTDGSGYADIYLHGPCTGT